MIACSRHDKGVLLIFSVFLILFFSILALRIASGEKNLTIEKNAELCINESKQILSELLSENFSIQRVNDSLREAENWYNAQSILKEKNRGYNFSLISSYCSEIKSIRDSAFAVRDEFMALKRFYSESITVGMNTSSIDSFITLIGEEIKNERYEKVKPLIDRTYKEITNVKSAHTTLALFYRTTTRSIKTFFSENWIYILIVVVLFFILLIVYKKAVLKWIVNRKIERLEIRKKTIKTLICQTQKDYFQYGKLSEGLYNIRTKKFAELIRDVDRQIPLLKEEIAKLEKSKRAKGKVYKL